MEIVNIDDWNRKEHFQYFNSLDYPYLNICGNIDMTNLYRYIKSENLPVFITILYLTSKVANEIQGFRMRIRQENVVLHHMVRPSFTVLNKDKSFSYCTVDFIDSYNEFKNSTQKQIDFIMDNPSIKDEENVDDMLFITSLPWISFTSINHPVNLKPSDSFPRISWGKISINNDKIELPLSIQGHHGLIDGYHIGEYFKKLEEMFRNPELYLK